MFTNVSEVLAASIIRIAQKTAIFNTYSDKQLQNKTTIHRLHIALSIGSNETTTQTLFSGVIRRVYIVVISGTDKDLHIAIIKAVIESFPADRRVVRLSSTQVETGFY
jgi:hypothetical protein